MSRENGECLSFQVLIRFERNNEGIIFCWKEELDGKEKELLIDLPGDKKLKESN